MRIGFRQQYALEQLFRFFDEDAIDTAPAAFPHHLVCVNVGSLCGLAMNLEFLKAFLYPLPVFPIEILEDAGADQQESFFDAMDAGVGRVGLEAVLLEAIMEPGQERLAGIIVSFGISVCRLAGFDRCRVIIGLFIRVR